VPRRRCVGCGGVAPKDELIRLAIERDGDGARAVCDPDGTRPGRGAYLCRGERSGQPAAACLQRALKRAAIPRTLRAAVAVDPKLVESMGR
jgi:predicted RNA-binding protein YlxR (DUF448 family)